MEILIDFKDFGATEVEMDSIYSNEKYDEPFYVYTKSGKIHKVNIAWEQGRNNNYRFVTGSTICYSDSDIIWPKDVTHIESKG